MRLVLSMLARILQLASSRTVRLFHSVLALFDSSDLLSFLPPMHRSIAFHALFEGTAVQEGSEAWQDNHLIVT